MRIRAGLGSGQSSVHRHGAGGAVRPPVARNEEDFVKFAQSPGKSLRDALMDLGMQAVAASAPYSDNTSAAALRWRGA